MLLGMHTVQAPIVNKDVFYVCVCAVYEKMVYKQI